jgi:hypothetical protein
MAIINASRQLFYIYTCPLYPKQWTNYSCPIFMDFQTSCLSLYPFIVCLYMYCCWRSSYQEGRAKVPLTCISPPHLCACPKPESGFLTSHVMVFSLCSVSLVKMRGECSLCLILVDWIPSLFRLTLENTEGAIKNGQSRETSNIGYTRRRKTKEKHNAIFVGHYFSK